MRDDPIRPRARGSQDPWLERRVDFARGHWRREEGAVRSAGWWESVTVTWSPVAPAPAGRPALLRRALAVAVDAIAPSVIDLAAAGALRLVDRQRRARLAMPSPGRILHPAARELPPPDRGR